MIKIGDRIRDMEDSDCYYEGKVTLLGPLFYLCDKVVWNGEEEKDSENLGRVITQKWWVVQKQVNGVWLDVPSRWKITVGNEQAHAPELDHLYQEDIYKDGTNDKQ